MSDDATLTSRMTGGSALAKRLREIADRLGDHVSLRVGFLEDARYADGTPVAQVAFWNEYGTTRAPPRPFMRSMVTARSPGWGKALGRIVKDNDYDARVSLALMGEGIAGQIQRSINEFTTPENAPATVEKKGFNKPLIDKAWMLRSVDYQVMSERDVF